MQVTRKIAAAAAVATVATLGLATVVSANMIDDTTKGANAADASALTGYAKGGKHWYWVKGNGGLVAVDNTNLGPFQACHNNVPVNAVGGQVPVSDVTGIVGIFSSGNQATAVKTCELDSKTNSSKWYRVGDDGLVSVSNTNVGPFQACHNNIPVNAVGGQVPISDIAALLGLGSHHNSVDTLKTCELESSAN
ncbi:hypothetical protein [Kribbella sp. CA-293567]|uniref:hypothetical protein n=1 Tax=Kribbella sp. CA-293567 TaxID=3002436 RepID=UPI0022DD324B|nr:hypothetical protein [Kribbella sp. CA-293567]WBQ05719.1 hypothetical protein OX958_02695 [Kribbella sp. CA-293567]